MDFTVRELGEKDIPAAVRMRVGIQLTDCGGNLGIPEEVLRERTDAFLRAHLGKDLFMFGAFREEELVSVCGLTVLPFFPQANDLSGTVGYVNSVYTLPAFRRMGAQRLAFGACLKKGEELGIVRYHLSTKNPAAAAMYRSFGFADDPEAMEMRTDRA